MTPTERLEAVSSALFPPSTANEDGSKILHDADENLSAAIYDLERLQADKVCISTISRVLKQIQAARDILAPLPWNKK